MNKCTGCRQDFTGVTNFDAHQSFTKEGNRLVVVCADPADLGMEKNDRGQWGKPGPLAFTEGGYVPAAERPAHEYERTCTECGTIFERPRRRGRPPTKCEDCR
jgi:hypothetical protein